MCKREAFVHTSRGDGGRGGSLEMDGYQVGRYKANGKREFKHSWREAGPLDHPDDKVDPDQ